MWPPGKECWVNWLITYTTNEAQTNKQAHKHTVTHTHTYKAGGARRRRRREEQKAAQSSKKKEDETVQSQRKGAGAGEVGVTTNWHFEIVDCKLWTSSGKATPTQLTVIVGTAGAERRPLAANWPSTVSKSTDSHYSACSVTVRGMFNNTKGEA